MTLVSLPDLRGCKLVSFSASTILLTEISPEYLEKQVLERIDVFNLTDPRNQHVDLGIVVAAVALSVELHWIVQKENVTYGAIDTTVFLLKHPTLQAIFGFGRHS